MSDEQRVERHWNTQGPDAAGKTALIALLAEVRTDERAAAVAYLRSHRIVCRLGSKHGLAAVLADEIERGDHVAETSEPGGDSSG